MSKFLDYNNYINFINSTIDNNHASLELFHFEELFLKKTKELDRFISMLDSSYSNDEYTNLTHENETQGKVLNKLTPYQKLLYYSVDVF